MADTPSQRRVALTQAQLSGASQTRQFLSALVHLASDLNSSLDLATLLGTVLAKAQEIMEVEACSLLFADETTGDLVTEAMLSPMGQLQETPRRIRKGEAVAGQVALSRAPHLTNEPEQPAACERAPAGCATVESRLCVPLVAKDRVLGVAQAVNRKGRRPFTEDDRVLFRAFADMAAVSIANARMHRDAVEHRKLEQEMATAREIQTSFLPTDLPHVPGLSFEACTEPARHVGGDYYDLFVRADGRPCVAVGDVSGKGPAAALYMACLQSELHLAMEYVPEPAAVLARLNDIMHARSRHGAFVTLLLVLLEPDRHAATVLSAGHPPPLIYTPADRRVRLLERKNSLPLGVLTGETYAATLVDLPPGTALLAFTDGVVEARNSDGEEFGLERLQTLFAEAAQVGRPVVPLVQERLRAFMSGAAQYDDITLAVVRAEDAEDKP